MMRMSPSLMSPTTPTRRVGLRPTVEDLLRTTAVFKTFAPEDRARLGSFSRVHVYGRHEAILDEGAPSEWLFAIATGRVKVFRIVPSGKDVILEILGPGEVFGSSGVFEGRPYPASAVALDKTACLLVPRRACVPLLEAHPSFVRGLLLGMTDRLGQLTGRLGETGGQVESRLARLFLKLADDVGRRDRGGIFIPVPLLRQELAGLTGTTVETCIRIMSRWGKQNIVRTHTNGFAVLDRKVLELLAWN